MRSYHSKTLSRELKTTSPSQKRLSMSGSQDSDDTLAAVTSVRRQLKTLMSKALDLSTSKRSSQFTDLVDACSRLESNLKTVVGEQKDTEEVEGEGIDRIEKTLIAHIRVGVPIAQMRTAVMEAFGKVRTQLSATNTELSTLNEDLLRELSESTEANQQLMQLLTRLQTDKATSRKQIITLKSENHQLRTQLRQGSGQMTLGEMEDGEMSLQREMEALTDQSADIRDAKDRLELSERKKLELNKELETLKKQLKDQKTQFEMELKSAKDTIISLQNHSEASKIAHLEGKNTLLEAEKLALMDAVRKSEEQAKLAMHELKLTVENQRVSRELKPQMVSMAGYTQSDLEQSVLRLQRLNSELNTELGVMKKEHHEVMERLSQFQGMCTAELAGQKKSMNMRESKQASVEALQLKLVSLEEQLSAALQEKARLEVAGASQTEVNALKSEIDALKLENLELATVVKQAQSQIMDVQNCDFRSIDEAKQHLILLTRKLADAEATNTILRRRNTLEMEVPSLESQPDVEEKDEGINLGKIQAEMKKIREEYEEKMKTLREDNEALQASYEDLEKYGATVEKRYLGQIESLKMEIETKSALFQEQILSGVKKIRDLRLELDAVRGEGKESFSGLTVLRRVTHDNSLWWLLSNNSSSLWTHLPLPYLPDPLPNLQESLDDHSFTLYSANKEKVPGEKLVATVLQTLGGNQ